MIEAKGEAQSITECMAVAERGGYSWIMFGGDGDELAHVKIGRPDNPNWVAEQSAPTALTAFRMALKQAQVI